MFLRYARESSRGHVDAELYRVYVTDCLKGLAGVPERYMEWIKPTPDFDAGEVISSVIEKAGLEVC